MGTCTVAIRKRTGITPTGSCRVVDITLSSSYATGGDTVPLTALELRSCDALVLSGTPAGYAAEVVHGDVGSTTAPKIKLYEDKATAASTPLSEEAAGVDVSSVTVRAVVYGDNPNP